MKIINVNILRLTPYTFPPIRFRAHHELTHAYHYLRYGLRLYKCYFLKPFSKWHATDDANYTRLIVAEDRYGNAPDKDNYPNLAEYLAVQETNELRTELDLPLRDIYRTSLPPNPEPGK